jgi:hypothetical protein
VTPATGSSAGEENLAAVNYRAINLPTGNYTATIAVSSAQATNSPQTITVSLTIVNVPGDMDGDDDVDQADFGLFQACYSGFGEPETAECEKARLNYDDFVDQLDFAIFQACFSGPDMPVDPDCAG